MCFLIGGCGNFWVGGGGGGVTAEWRKLHNEGLHNLYSKYDRVDEINLNDVYGKVNTYKNGDGEHEWKRQI
jgi:hypothetical protein